MDDQAVANDFQAARANAPLDDGWMKELAAGPATAPAAGPGQAERSPPVAAGENGNPAGAGQPSATSSLRTDQSSPQGGAAASPAARPDANLPLGLRVDQAYAPIAGMAAGQSAPGQTEGQRQDEAQGPVRSTILDAIKQGFGSEPLGMTPEDKASLNWLGETGNKIANTLAIPIDAAARGMNAMMTGGVQTAVDALKLAGVSDEFAERFGRDLTLAAQTLPMEAGLRGGGSARAAKPAAETSSRGPASQANQDIGKAGVGDGEVSAAPDVTVAGKPLDPVNVTPEIQKQAADYLNGRIAAGAAADDGLATGATQPGGNPIQASLDSITRDPRGTEAIKQIASFIPKGAVVPDDVLKMNAYAMQMAPEDVLSGPVGQLPDATQTGAWKMRMDALASEFGQISAKAIEQPGTDTWTAAARAYAAMNQAIGAWEKTGSEQGSSFRARNVQFDERPSLGEQMRGMLDAVGPDNVESAIRGAAALTKDNPEKVAPFVSTLRRMVGRNGLLFGYYNMLLSNPATVVKKVASDASLGVWNVATTAAAETIGRAGLNSGGVVPGETAALVTGYIGATSDAFRAAGKALRAGGSQFDPTSTSIDGAMRTRLSMLASGHDPGTPASPAQSAWTYLRAALPTSWIGAADDFGKVVNFRAEARRLIYRDGVGKFQNADGSTDQAGLAQHMSDNLNAIPGHIANRAMDQARINTLTEPLDGIAQKIADVVDDLNIGPRGGFQIPLGRIVLPFMRIGANVMNLAYRSSPLPLVPWLRSQGMQFAMAAPGPARDLAMARIGLGSAAITAALGHTLMGGVTGGGPKDPAARAAWERAGNRPYSITPPWGGQAVSYRGVEPIGFMLGSIADTVDVMKFAAQKDVEQAASSVVLGIGNALLSAQYLSGMAGFLDALNQPQQDGERWARGLIASMTVPAGVSSAERATDEWQRAHYGLLDTIAARTPGLSKNLPGVQNLWGEDIKLDDAFVPGLSDTGAARALSPWKLGPDQGAVEPIDKWIWQNRDAFPENLQGRYDLPTKPSRTLQMSNGGVSAQVQLDPQQYHRYLELAGNGIALPRTGVGLKETLNGLVAGTSPDASLQNSWNRESPAGQANLVRLMIGQTREAAKAQLMREDGRIGDAIKAQFTARASALRPDQSRPQGPGAIPASSGAPGLAGTAGTGTKTAPVLE